MFKRIKSGVGIIEESILFFAKNPKILAPLLVCWLIYASLTFYFYFFFPWVEYGLYVRLLFLFLMIFIISVSLGLACLVLLEIIQQIESNQPVNVLQAFKDILNNGLTRALPVLFVWSALWFLLVVLELLLSKKKKKSGNQELFDSIQKGMRMVVFLILPAIAWENLQPIDAFKKAVGILDLRLKDFLNGFILTELAAMIFFLPAAALAFFLSEADTAVTNGIWYAVIIYCVFAWSFTFFVEQLFTAELYLWHLKWKKAYDVADENDERHPSFYDIRRPSVLDNVPEFLNLGSIKHQETL